MVDDAGVDLPADAADVEVYADFLRIVLEVINAALSANLAANPELVYALLHRHQVFAPLRSHPRCAELLDNLYLVIDSFSSQVELLAISLAVSTGPHMLRPTYWLHVWINCQMPINASQGELLSALTPA